MCSNKGVIDAEGLVSKLRVTFASGVTRSLGWRRDQLAAMSRMLIDAEDELIEALRSDLGRPRVEAYGADVGHTKAEISYLTKHLEKWMKPKRVMLPAAAMPGRGSIVTEPLGVALVISPWNYPIQLLLEPMAAAIAAGNCVLGKPSEVAPACSDAIARLVPQYLDTSAVAIVEGGVPETTELLDTQWDHIFFTGSTTIGRVVAEAAAKHLTPTTLELGGKSPTYRALVRGPRRCRAAHRLGEVLQRRADVHRTGLRPRRPFGEGRVGRATARANRQVLRRRPEPQRELRAHREPAPPRPARRPLA